MSELTKEQKERAAAVEAAEKAWKECPIDSPENVAKSMELQAAYLKAQGEANVKNFEEKIAALEAASKEAATASAEQLKDITGKLEATIAALDIVQARVKDVKNAGGPAKEKTFNENLTEAIEGAADKLKALAKTTGNFNETIEMKDVGDMSIAANFPGATPWIQEASNRLIVQPYNRVWLADLLPQGTTAGSSVIYPKENGGEGGAAPWTNPATDKAQIDWDFTTQTSFVKWIAGYVVVAREMLDDIPWLTSYIRNKMLISLKTAENNFVLNGTSDSNPVDGLLDVATAYDGLMTFAVDQIIDAAYGQIPEDTFDFYTGNLTLLNPRDLVRVGLNKAVGSGEYDLPVNSVSYAGGQLNVAGIQTVSTTGMSLGEFLNLDRNAVTFIRRMQPEIRVFEDATLAKKNKVMFRIEERATMTIFNDEAIVKGTLVFPTPS